MAKPSPRPRPRQDPPRESAESEALRLMLGDLDDVDSYLFICDRGTPDERIFCWRCNRWHWAKHRR